MKRQEKNKNLILKLFLDILKEFRWKMRSKVIIQVAIIVLGVILSYYISYIISFSIIMVGLIFFRAIQSYIREVFFDLIIFFDVTTPDSNLDNDFANACAKNESVVKYVIIKPIARIILIIISLFIGTMTAFAIRKLILHYDSNIWIQILLYISGINFCYFGLANEGSSYTGTNPTEFKVGLVLYKDFWYTREYKYYPLIFIITFLTYILTSIFFYFLL